MAVRLREFPWASQPPEAADINWLHSRSLGLCFFAPLSDSNGFRDLVRGNFLTRTGLGSAVTSGGVSTRLFGTSSYADFTPPPEIGPTTPFSVSWTQEAISPSAYGTILNVNFGTAGVHSAFVIYQAVADAAYYFTAGPRNTNGAHSWSASIGAITAGRVDRFTLVAAAGSQSLTASDWTLYRNGALISRGTSGSFGVNTASAGRIGARDAASDPWEGSITDLRMWARALAPTEAADESISAGDLYEPQRIWVPVAAVSGNVTVSLTGQAASTSAGSLAAAFELSMSGQASSASLGSLMPEFSIPLVGAQATISSGSLLTEVALAITGLAATGSQGTVTANTGNDITVSLTGLAATGAQGSLATAFELTPGGEFATAIQGSLSYYNEIGLVGLSATAQTGSLVVGTTITLTGSAGTSATGSLSSTGGTPASNIARPAGDLVTTGWTATPGAGFYSMLNEVSPSDAEYVTGPVGASQPLEMTLDKALSAGTYVVGVRAQGVTGQIRAVLEDNTGASVGATAWQSLTSTMTTYSLAVTITGTAEKVRLELQ